MNKYISTSRVRAYATRLGVLVCAGLSLGAFSSCRQQPDTLFDRPASERIDAFSSEIQKTLTSSTSGWILEYYPHGKQLYGGYPIAITFGEKGDVVMASDAPLSDHTIDEVKSNYHLKSDKMVSLSFDTYNEALHLFSDPDKSYGAGEGKSFEGDYEFTFVRSVSPDTLYLKGRKTGTVMRMFRPKSSAKEYLAQVMNLKKQAYTSEIMYQKHLHGLVGKLGGKSVVAYLSNDGYNTMSIEDTESGKKTEVPYVYTPEGLRFFKEYNGISTLQWKDSDKSYTTSTGETLIARPDPDYEGFARYLGEYELKCNGWTAGRTVSFTQAARNLYRITGVAPKLTIYAMYDAAKDRFEIRTQKIEGAGGAQLCVWDSKAGNLSWGTGYGMYSHRNTSYTAGEQYTLMDNGLWGTFTAYSFILWKPGTGEYKAFGDSRFQQPVFTKK